MPSVTFSELDLLLKLPYSRNLPHILVDVGAHVGTSSKPFAEQGWRIIAFEPEPNNYKEYCKNLKQYPNVTCINKAISDISAQKIDFFVSSEHYGIHSLKPFHPSHQQIISVETIRLDDFLSSRQIDKVDLLKIDTEGADFLALKSFDFNRIKPQVVICEFMDDRSLPNFKYTFHDMALYMQKFGYRVYVSEWGKIKSYGRKGIETEPSQFIDCYPYPPDHQPIWGNLIFITPEFAEFFEKILMEYIQEIRIKQNLFLSNNKLVDFKNRHLGERCVIIGNGPSLNKMDLSFLKNEVCFGMNRIYLGFERWGFTSTYYVSVNSLVLEQSADEIQNIPCPKFISLNGLPYFKDPTNLYFLHTENMQIGKGLPELQKKIPAFSRDPRLGICEGYTVTYVVMQLAYFMGFDEVILIGVDHNFVTPGPANKEIVSQGDDPNHFESNYFGKGFRWNLPDLTNSERSYLRAKNMFESEGRIIIDATVDGKLTIFPKADYRELFDKSRLYVPRTNLQDLRNAAEILKMILGSNNINAFLIQNQKRIDERVIRLIRQHIDNAQLAGENTLVGNLENLEKYISQNILENHKKKKLPKISILTPSYQQGQYIEQNIQSVLTQDYPNFEHIIVDGGSTDGTIDVLKKYQHLKWVSEPDDGQSDALNKSLSMVTGEIIGWINSDDYYADNAFNNVAVFFQEHPDANIVIGDCLFVHTGKGNKEIKTHNEALNFEQLIRYWNDWIPPTQPSIFFRKALIQEVGDFDQSLHKAMDYDLWLRIALKYKLHYVPQLLAYYRLHSGSKSGTVGDWSPFYDEWNTVYCRYKANSKILPQKPLISIVVLLQKEDMLQANKINEIRTLFHQISHQIVRDIEILVITDIKNAEKDFIEKLSVPLKWVFIEKINKKIFVQAINENATGFAIHCPVPGLTISDHFYRNALNKLLDLPGDIQPVESNNSHPILVNDDNLGSGILCRRESIETNETTPWFSIIIPTYNRSAILEKCLNKLSEQTFPASGFEVFVCDDGSTDNTKELIESFRAEYHLVYLQQENRGPASARNMGIRKARGRYLLILNDDAMLEPDGIDQHYQAHLAHPNGKFAVLGKFLLLPEDTRSPFGYLVENSDQLFSYVKMQGGQLYNYNYFYTCNISILRQVVVDIGMFDEDFTGPAAEDIEIGFRLAQKGYKVLFEPKSIAWHDHHLSPEDFCKVHHTRGQGWVSLCIKQPEINNLLNLDWNIIHQWQQEFEKARSSKKSAFQVIEDVEVLAAQSNYDLSTVQQLGRKLLPLVKLLHEWSFREGVMSSPNLAKLIEFNSQKKPGQLVEKIYSKSPLVSVIIPCYNHAYYLPEAVFSVLAQTYQNFEIIIINDGSTDNSRQIAERLISSNPGFRIRLINQENSGQPAISRNNGIQAAQGEYILPLDADDKIHPTFLEKCLLILEADPSIGIVFTDIFNFSENITWVDKTGGFTLKNLCANNHQIAYCSLYRKVIWLNIKGYKTNVKGYEDWDFWISCAEKGYKAAKIDLPLFIYRLKEDRIDSDSFKRDQQIKAQIALNHPGLYDETTMQKANKIINNPGNEDQSGDFNEASYLSYYKDIAETVEAGQFRSGREHYEKYGKFENRIPDPLILIPRSISIENRDNELETFLQVAYEFLAQKNVPAALRVIENAMEIFGDESALIVKMGNILLQSGDIEAARKEFFKATILAPNFAPGHALLGLVLIYLKQYPEAEESLRKALALNPQDITTRNLLTTLEAEKQQGVVFPHDITTKQEQPDNQPPIFSVIIPTYNRKEILKRCLDALVAQTFPAQQFEVIVCDDGSNDGTEQWIKTYHPQYHLIYLQQSNRGPGAARNMGLHQSTGEYILFLNDDAVSEPDSLAIHYSIHQKHSKEKIAVLGRFSFSPSYIQTPLDYLLENSEILFDYRKWNDGMIEDLLPGQLLNHYWFYTCNISLLRQALFEVGLFDEDFTGPAAEDIEIGFRLAKKGYKVRFEPKSIAWHEHHLSPEDFLKVQRTRGQGWVTLCTKYPELNTLMNLDWNIIHQWQQEFEKERSSLDRALQMIKDAADLAAQSNYDVPTVHQLARKIFPLLKLLRQWSDREGIMSSPILAKLIELNSKKKPGGFNETAYLSYYEDIAAAVKAGQFRSGREHYEKYGKFEYRIPDPSILLNPRSFPIENRDNNLERYLQEADDFLTQKNITAALRVIENGIEILGDEPTLIVKKGNIYLQSGDIETARKEFVKATTLAPNFAPGHALLGLVLIYLKQYPEAEKSLRRALTLNPQDTTTRNLLTTLEAEQQRVAVSRNHISTKQEKPDNNTPIFSVIIPTHNRILILKKCLDALARQTFPANKVEVFVCDDNSTDETEAVVRSIHTPYKLEYLRQPARGPAAARNMGIRRATGKYILSLNDDSILAPDGMERHYQQQCTHAGERLSVAGIFSITPEFTRTPLGYALEHTDLLFRYAILIDGHYYDYNDFTTANLSILRQAVIDVGLFDENFTNPAYEDIDLGYRLYQVGFHVLYDAKCVAWHDHVSDVSDFAKVHASRGSGAPNIIIKFPEGPWYPGDFRAAETIRQNLLAVEPSIKEAMQATQQLNDMVGATDDQDLLQRTAGQMIPTLRAIKGYHEQTGLLSSPLFNQMVAARTRFLASL